MIRNRFDASIYQTLCVSFERMLSDRARKNNAISICLLQAQPDLMYVTRLNGENSRLNRPLPGFI